MYLHQSNNLNNGINLSSNHNLNSLNNSINMSDLHSDTFHNHHLNSTQTTNHSPTSSSINLHLTDQNNKDYLEKSFKNHLNDNKLVDGEYQFDFTPDSMSDEQMIENPLTLKLSVSLSCSPSNSISSATSSNPNAVNDLISNSTLNRQLNQIVTNQTNEIDFEKDLNTDKFNLNQNQNDITGMDPLTRFLSLHPKYLELFNKFYNFLFNGDGPLQYTVRHYIAIMASARHYCKYLVNDQIEQFKKVGGDCQWLKGIQFTPKKIQNLNEINKILAHQPWLLTKEHIERLTKGDDNWSLSELVQAIVIMTQFHSLSSFIFGCGFNDADQDWATKAITLTSGLNYNSNNISDLLSFDTHINSSPPSPPSPSPPLFNNTGINSNDLLNENLATNKDKDLKKIKDGSLEQKILIEVNQNLGQKTSNKKIENYLSDQSTQKSNQQANTLEILMRKMQNISKQKQLFELENQEELVKNQSLEIHLASNPNLTNEFNFNLSPTSLNSGQSNNNSNQSSPSLLTTSKCLGNDDEQFELTKFVFDPKFCYIDFAKQRAREDINTFRVVDYSWSDHAYSLVNRLYSDVGNFLDEKFVTTYNLTYYTMGKQKNVDTSVFRYAIWMYIQSLFGIRHDDYHYRNINELLERPLKTYIKTVCCYPHQTTKKQCDSVMKEFRRSEKIHVNIMITEARLQAELLYALRTISKHLT